MVVCLSMLAITLPIITLKTIETTHFLSSLLVHLWTAFRAAPVFSFRSLETLHICADLTTNLKRASVLNRSALRFIMIVTHRDNQLSGYNQATKQSPTPVTVLQVRTMLVFVFIFSRFTQLSVYPPGPDCFTNVLRHAFVGRGPEWW